MTPLERKEYNREYSKKYLSSEENRLKAIQRAKKWTEDNREKRNEYARLYSKKKRDSDINFRIKANLRTRLSCAISRNQKSGSAIRDLGCSMEFFKEYITQLFRPNMSWENYGKWHIDHIKPLGVFELSDRAQFLEACNYKNLQPMWAEDNLKKGMRI